MVRDSGACKRLQPACGSGGREEMGENGRKWEKIEGRGRKRAKIAKNRFLEMMCSLWKPCRLPQSTP